MLSPIQEALLRRTFLDYQSTEEFLGNPLVIDRAEGLFYWDANGKRYFDGIGGIFVAALGHRHPRVMDAMRRQMERVTFIPPLHATSIVTLEFIERLGAVAPLGLDYVKPFSGGSESIESALKFVRQYHRQTGNPGKYKFVSRYQGYHGGTFGGMAASGTGARKTPYEPHLTGFLKVFPPTHYTDRFATWEEANRFAAQSVEDVILHEDPSTVAGVLVEPIGNTGGVITPTEEYFQILRTICDRHNVSLIFDEIITGIGRTGAMFAAQAFGVTPDIICSGKGLSSGAIPLGSMIARTEMAEAFRGPIGSQRNFSHGHTFAGNPLACAAGIAVIDEIVEQDLCSVALRRGEYLAGLLRELEKTGLVTGLRGRGMLLGMDFTVPGLGRALKKTALTNGLILRIDPDWFAVAPPLIATEGDLDEMSALLARSLNDAVELAGAPAASRGGVSE